MTNAVEPARQYMDQEAADELLGAQCHDALAICTIATIVFEPEGDARIVEAQEATDHEVMRNNRT